MLPRILEDADLSHAFFTLWERQTAPRLAPSAAELKGVLRQCAAAVAALMGSQVRSACWGPGVYACAPFCKRRAYVLA